MPEDTYEQTVQITKDAAIIANDPSPDAFRTDLAQAAHEGITEDITGEGFQKGTVEVTPGGE
jgi:hypothetical protein